MLVARREDKKNRGSPHSSSLKSGWKYLKITSAFLLPITGDRAVTAASWTLAIEPKCFNKVSADFLAIPGMSVKPVVKNALDLWSL